MAEYFCREDGSAASLLAATGPATVAASCASPATYQSGRASLSAGDIVTFTNRGGVIDSGITIDKSGSVGSPISYRGEAGFLPHIDISALTTTSLAAIELGASLSYVDIDGFDLTGNGSKAAFRHNETGTGSTTVRIGKNARVKVLDNRGVTLNTVHDGFSCAGNAKWACGVIEAYNCTELVPAGGPEQALTTHDTCAITVDSLTAINCNYHVVPANGSSIIIGTVTLGEWLVKALNVDAAGGSIIINGGTIAATAHSNLFDINTIDGTGQITLNDVDVSIVTADGAADETNYGGTVEINGGSWLIQSDRFRMRPRDKGSIAFRGVVLNLDKWDTAANFVNNVPFTGTDFVKVEFSRNRLASNGGVGGGRLIQQNSTHADSTVIVESNLWDELVCTSDYMLIGSTAIRAPVIRHNICYKLGGVSFLDQNINAAPNATNVAKIHSNIFHDCFDPLDLASAGNADVQSNRYSGTSPNDGGTNATTGDPLFVNAAGGDFRLQAGSPAMAAGFPLTAPLLGINGLYLDETAPNQGPYASFAGTAVAALSMVTSAGGAELSFAASVAALLSAVEAQATGALENEGVATALLQALNAQGAGDQTFEGLAEAELIAMQGAGIGSSELVSLRPTLISGRLFRVPAANRTFTVN